MDKIEIMKKVCHEMNIEWDENASSIKINGQKISNLQLWNA